MSAQLVADVLGRLHREGGTVLVTPDVGAPARYRVAALRSSMVTFERTNHRGVCERITRRLSLGRIGP